MLHAYIDESGDRGLGPRSSDHFIMSAIVVRDRNLPQIATTLASIRDDLGKPVGSYLTWKNVRSHTERTRIAQIIGAQTWLKISTVVACKRHLPPTAINQSQIYLYQFRFLLERLSWIAREEGETLEYTLAHIRGFKITELRNYESVLKAVPGCQVHWPALDAAGGKIDQPQRLEALQFADLVASATGAAFNPDRFGNVETRYLIEMKDRLYRRGTSPLTSYGLKMHPWSSETTRAAYPWVAAL